MKNKLHKTPFKKTWAFDDLDKKFVCVVYEDEDFLVVKQRTLKGEDIYFVYEPIESGTFFRCIIWNKIDVAWSKSGALDRVRHMRIVRDRSDNFFDECINK